MKLENLEVGMKIKNYKKLCELMEEPEKSGASKRAQVSEWERYVSFERQGNAFIVKEIRDVPLVSQDGRMKYMQYVEPLLLQYLSKWCSADMLVEHTFEDWCTQTSLISKRAYDEDIAEGYQNLISANFNKPEQAFSTLTVQKARYEITHLAKNALISAATALENKGIIYQHSITYIVKNATSRQATPEENTYIDNVKKRILASMQLDNMFSVNMSPKKWKEFYKRQHEIYLTEKGWSKTYTLYAIKILDDKFVKRYSATDVNELSSSFKKEALITISRKLAAEAKKGAQTLLCWFDQFGDEEIIDTDDFIMTEMIANDTKFLVEEML